MANIKIDLAAEFTGAAAFKKAGKASNNLQKTVKSLGKTMGLALSAAAITSFGKASVKAFMEDEKAAANLANTLKNLGVGFAVASNEKFIASLEQSTQVADDFLRPALAKLATQTGSLTYAQGLLTDAIEISRGSGVDLETVSNDLSKAYVGNYKGLKKYALGLSDTELATMSFSDIMLALNKQFKGSSAAYLQTYAGKMDALTLASSNAQETIGKGLLDAITLMAGGGEASITSITDSIGNMSTVFADTIRGIGFYIGELMKNPWVERIWNIVKWFSKHTSFLGALTTTFAPKGAELNKEKDTKALTDAQKKVLAMQAEHAKKMAALAQKQKAQADKDAKLKKASALFDLEHIQLVAALQGQVSDEDRKRLRLQMALLDGNTYEAEKLSQELANSIDSTGKLAEWLRTLPDAKNPFAAWSGYLTDIEKQAARIAAFGTAGGGNTGKPIPPVIGLSAAIPTTNAEAIASGNNVTGFNRFGVETGGNQTIQVDLNVDGKLLAQVLQDASLNGNQVYVNRITGGFYQ
jgi:hypothetical protein